jgi:hypothetical protein
LKIYGFKAKKSRERKWDISVVETDGCELSEPDIGKLTEYNFMFL